MPTETEMVQSNLKFLTLLAREYPTVAKASSEIINLEAILKLPKPTEHFMSDLHGEYEAFTHILNNASGVIRNKVDRVLGDSVSEAQRAEFATLIYYPEKKLPQMKQRQSDLSAFYLQTLYRLIDVCRVVSSKHTRSFVRKRLPAGFEYIIDELLHAHFEDHDKEFYYGRILSSIIDIGRADAFIIALCGLIKRLAVFKLHIVGDLFDRGPRPDIIIDKLMVHHSVDIQWGNHDVAWMGAAAGSPVCIATVINTTLAYNNLEALEDSYGINLRPLAIFAEKVYGNSDVSRFLPKLGRPALPYEREGLLRTARMHKAIAVILAKLEYQVILRNPEFHMGDRALIKFIDFSTGTIELEGKTYPLADAYLPTVDPRARAVLTAEERQVMEKLCQSFSESERLGRHIRFLYAKGSIYRIENGNLMFHGAVPMTEQGTFAVMEFEGRNYSGRALMDYCEARARRGYFAPEGSPERQSGGDFLWYLWCGRSSPLFGRDRMTTFERLFVNNPAVYEEKKDPYYHFMNDEATANAILKEFEVRDPEEGHIINGHVPVRAANGEHPVKANGKIIVIDGGFCRAYHEKTGIAGYTLVFNSHGLSLRAHEPFETTQKAITENRDIVSTVDIFETVQMRLLVGDTDEGCKLKTQIADLKLLLAAYRQGLIKEG